MRLIVPRSFRSETLLRQIAGKREIDHCICRVFGDEHFADGDDFVIGLDEDGIHLTAESYRRIESSIRTEGRVKAAI